MVPPERSQERSAAPSAATNVVARIRTSAEQLGFARPPMALRLKLLTGSRHSSLFIRPEAEGRLAAIVEWLEPWSPMRIEFGSRSILRADFDPLPAAWAERFHAVEVQSLLLYPDGGAVATLVGAHAALAAVGRRLVAQGDHDLQVRRVADAPRDTPLLTHAQDEALRAAVDAGYYKIPRPLTLHQLAARLGISPASLSERLRRAEGRIIMRYTQDGATTPWDSKTIFSDQTAEARAEESALLARAFRVGS